MTDETTSPGSAPRPDTAASPSTRGKRNGLVILSCIALAALIGGGNLFITSQTRIETDNAFVEARIIPVSAKVAGTIMQIPVADNQLVSKGDLLVVLDPRDFQVQVEKAEAGIGIAENETGGEQLKVAAAHAALQSAEVRREQAVLDLVRGEKLFNREVIPREQLDRLRTAKQVADAQVKESEETLKRTRAEAGLARNDQGNKAKIRQRKAQLDESRLNLSYTRILAPCDGYITRKSAEAGVNIQAGQPLMALVPLGEAWVTANYKESQLTHIKPGQNVSFTVDAYPGKRFNGRVDSIMAGTGAAFSLLPPENATGNYVKVVQRVPVKILIDSASDHQRQLRVGMSVIPVIDTGRTAGDVIKELTLFK